MGTCIVCGASTDGRVCSMHEEDVFFEFRGDSPDQLTPRRYYRGSVDGYADFGVFVDVGEDVTGLLHRSELPGRLEGLDWEPGDEVFVQVTEVHDNGNVDLGWSIRQSPEEFRGGLVDDPRADGDPERIDGRADAAGETTDAAGEEADGSRTVPNGGAGAARSGGDATTGPDGDEATPSDGDAGSGPDDAATGSDGEEATATDAGSGDGPLEDDSRAEPWPGADEESAGTGDGPAATDEAAATRGEGGGAAATATATATTPAPERAQVETLGDRVGDRVRVEGEVVSVRQTGGPTVFEVRDETAAVDCAAFEAAGVRAYPEVSADDVVRVDGTVERRGDDLQVESESLSVLAGDERTAVEKRLEYALTAAAQPESVEPLADYAPVAGLSDSVAEAAEAIRRAVLSSRPVVVRHPATADGYAAGAAIERAVLPLVREEHAGGDAEYHYFDRRPMDDAVYDVAAATDDATSMLENRERHGEKLPLVVLGGAGSDAVSATGLELLSVYDVETVVVDAGLPAGDALDRAGVVVTPHRPDDDGSADEAADVAGDEGAAGDDAPGRPDTATADAVTATALAADVAAAVEPSAREAVAHLPAVSYWEDTPEAYRKLASEAGYDGAATRRLREAVALAAYFHSYEDKRELVADLLFGEPDDGLAEHVSEQFRAKLDEELETVAPSVDHRVVGDATLAVLDADAFAHGFEFPPTALLADALHRRERPDDGRFATLVLSEDDLRVRATEPVDLQAVAEQVREAVPDAGVTFVGGPDARVEFLVGEREAVLEAAIEAVADAFGRE